MEVFLATPRCHKSARDKNSHLFMTTGKQTRSWLIIDQHSTSYSFNTTEMGKAQSIAIDTGSWRRGHSKTALHLKKLISCFALFQVQDNFFFENILKYMHI